MIIIYIFGENLFAKWWLIDDHEIFRFLGNSIQKNSWSDFTRILLEKTEVGSFGNYPRYRPSYYFLRITETFLWRENSYLWYGFRILVFFLFSLSIFLQLSRWFSFLVSFFITLLFIIQDYYSDIISRLGPGEFYCLAGFTLILLANSFKRKISLSCYLFFIGLGSSIVIGSKENFLFLILLPVYLFLRYRKKIRMNDLISLFFPSIITGIVFFSLVITFSKGSSDIYGNSVGVSDRITRLVQSMSNFNIIVSLVSVSIMGSIRFFSKQKNIKNNFQINIFVFLILILNIIFYNGNFPQNNRYDFPAILCYQFLVISTIWIISNELLNLFVINRKIKNLYINLIILAWLLIILPYKNIASIENSAVLNRNRTNEFSIFLDRLRHLEPDVTLIIVYKNVLEFEPVDSLVYYLNYYNFPNSKTILIESPIAQNPWEQGLVNYMTDLSINGSLEFLLKPLDRIKLKSANCYVLIFKPSKIEDFQEKNLCRNARALVVPF